MYNNGREMEDEDESVSVPTIADTPIPDVVSPPCLNADVPGDHTRKHKVEKSTCVVMEESYEHIIALVMANQCMDFDRTGFRAGPFIASQLESRFETRCCRGILVDQ